MTIEEYKTAKSELSNQLLEGEELYAQKDWYLGEILKLQKRLSEEDLKTVLTKEYRWMEKKVTQVDDMQYTLSEYLSSKIKEIKS